MDSSTLYKAISADLRELLRRLVAEDSSLIDLQREGVLKFNELRKPTYEDFCKLLPTIQKSDIFGNAPHLEQILHAQKYQGLKLIPAAGTGKGSTAFRLHDEETENGQLQPLAQLVFETWKLTPQDTFIFNAYPAAIRIPKGLNAAEIGARADVFAGLLPTVAQSFKNIILLAQPHFLTFCLQEALIPNEIAPQIRFLLGGEYFPKTYPGFIANRLKLPEEQVHKHLMSLYGVAEVGLGIGVSLPETHASRKTSSLDFALNHRGFFLEEVDRELVITSLHPNLRFPFLRYRTGDHGKLLKPTKNTYLFSVDRRLPPESLRNEPSPENVQEILYGNSELYNVLTGHFWVTSETLTLETRPERVMPTYDRERIEELLRQSINVKTIRLKPSVRENGTLLWDLQRKARYYE